MKTRKNMTGAHASVYWENGQNANNAHKNERNVCPDRMLSCISKMGKTPKTI